jgi:hypothetical protein
MWTLLFIATVVLITFRMFVRHHEDRDRVAYKATLTDEDRARLRQLIEWQLATGKNVGDQILPARRGGVRLCYFSQVSTNFAR